MKSLRKFYQNAFQIDFFSQSYLNFEQDFYKYSAFDIPLVFLLDDILLSMASSQRNYFKLNKKHACDERDHYFFFQIKSPERHHQIKLFCYDYHSFNAKVESESNEVNRV